MVARAGFGLDVDNTFDAPYDERPDNTVRVGVSALWRVTVAGRHGSE